MGGWHCLGASMIRVYTAPTITMVGKVRDFLEANGIPCLLRNEFLTLGYLYVGAKWFITKLFVIQPGSGD